MRFEEFWAKQLGRDLTDIELEQAREVDDCLGRGAGLIVSKDVSEVVDSYYDYMRDTILRMNNGVELQ